MRKFLPILVLSVLVAILPAALGSAQIVVQHALGTTVIPETPKRVIIFDFGALETLEEFGIGREVVVGLPQEGVPTHLAEYTDPKFANVGTLVQPDMERVYSLQPDLIIMSGRLSTFYEEFSQIAPTLYVAIDFERYLDSFRENVRILGRIFGKEEKAEEGLAQIDRAVAALRARLEGNPLNALVVLVNDRSVSAYGPGSRFGLIHDEFGFVPVSRNIVSSTHGQSISFEFILAHNPDYLFVIDRTAVVSGQAAAKQVIENELVRFTKAYQNGNIVYLNPEVWYLSGGGLISMREMIAEVAAALE